MMRRGSCGLVALLGAVALLVGALGASASPVLAKGAKHKVLFKDSLEKSSKAVRPDSGPGHSWSFVKHKFLGRVSSSVGNGGTDYKPDFNGNELGASDLANVTIAVDVSLSSKRSSAAGPTCGDARSRDQYVLEISNKGRYTLTFESYNGGDTPNGSSPVTSGSVRTLPTNHLVLRCTQVPKLDGGVQVVTGKVNGRSLRVERVNAEAGSGYLYNPQVGLHVGEVGPLPAVPAAASFSDFEVTQVRTPPKTPLDWSVQATASTINSLGTKYLPVCSGTPVPTNAPYAGDTHPLFISESGFPGGYENLLGFGTTAPPWSRPAFAEDFQLLACATKTQDTVGPSCGTYTRADGVAGELRRASYDVSVRIVVAADGREIGQATLTGPFAPCPSQSTVQGDPPWTMGDGVHLDQVLQFVTGFTTGPPR